MSTAQSTRNAAAAADPSPAGALRSRLRPRGLAWLAWRQSRLAVWTLGGALLLGTLALLALHWRLGDLDHRLHGTCAQPGSWSRPGCEHPYADANDLVASFTDRIQPLVFGLPLVIGMFLGAPLLAQEYERGTVRTIRAQSVSPGRWLAARLAVPALLVVLAVGALSAATSWVWYADVHRAGLGFDPPFHGFTYQSIGVAPLAWSLFALAVGVTVGQLLRRTVPAVLVTGAVIGTAQLLLRAVRVHFLPLTEITVQSAAGRATLPFTEPRDAWLVHHGAVLPDGTRYTSTECWQHFEACDRATAAWAAYHPASHLIPLQLVEAALLTAVAALALWSTFHRLRRSPH